jgi:ribonuclease HII
MAIRRAPRPVKPSTRVERAHWSSGRMVVVGADAVGVASLSGPVVAAAVAWPPLGRRIPGIRDSKVLSRVQRERLFPLIRRRAQSVGIGAASVAEIDRLNIYHATNLAMRRAICRIGERDHVLIDGLRVRQFEESVGPYTAIVRGDARCYSIAAASIVAKVVRDRLMERLARRYPYYGWEHNAGYATLDHRRGIEQHGITVFHRRSFARVRAVALGEQMALDLDLAGLEGIDEIEELHGLHALDSVPEPALSGSPLISRQ